MKNRKLYYLASPYSHDDPDIREERYLVVQKAAIDLMMENVWAFSPITYNHPMLPIRQFPTSFDFWEEYDKAFIDHSTGLIVLMMDGWKESIGVTEEIRYAEELGIPVYYIEPENVVKDYFLKALR